MGKVNLVSTRLVYEIVAIIGFKHAASYLIIIIIIICEGTLISAFHYLYFLSLHFVYAHSRLKNLFHHHSVSSDLIMMEYISIVKSCLLRKYIYSYSSELYTSACTRLISELVGLNSSSFLLTASDSW